jgi:hypothetical protein
VHLPVFLARPFLLRARWFGSRISLAVDVLAGGMVREFAVLRDRALVARHRAGEA